MTTFFITWFSIFVLAFFIKRLDFSFENNISYSKIDHTYAAKGLFFLGCCILIFVAGCRYNVGSDYYAYYGWYQSYAESFFERLRTFDEPGISFIYWVTVKFINDGAACVFVANAIMIFLILCVFKRNTDNIALALILYSLICWDATFNGMRQALATAILFLGFPYLRDKKLIKYCIIVFLAFLCHKSAIVFILLYFIVHRKIDGKNLILILVASFVVLYSYDAVFNFTNWVLDKDIDTQGAYISRTVNFLRVAANIAPSVFFLIRYWKKEKSEAESFYLNLLIIHGVVSLVTLNSAYLARLNMYTAPFEIIAISELVKGKKESKSVLEIGIIILFLIFEIYQVWASPDLNSFHWIWSR